MGSIFNLKNFGDQTFGESTVVNNKPPGTGMGTFTLTRQPSVYSLTLDEFQSTLCGGVGKDFGSMNMDELLKSIWTAEEAQALGLTSVDGDGEGSGPVGNLQRQGSLTLPRTLSQKTVDEVWRDLTKESNVQASNMPQRQPTLGEMTLEQFLFKAGVVREDLQPPIGRPNDNAELIQNNNTGLIFGFSQNKNGFFANRMEDNKNSISHQPPLLSLSMAGVGSSQHPLLPKPVNVAFASSVGLGNDPNPQLVSPALVSVAEPAMNTAVVQSVGVGMVGSRTAGINVAVRPPVTPLSSFNMAARNSAEPSLLSPVPYVFGRGRRSSGALEKVVERRQRRMIKNRESAARSRARKQAYTLELEAEVEKLKEINKQLQRKQAEIMEMKEAQLKEKIKRQLGGKRRCLRRTLTGPW